MFRQLVESASAVTYVLRFGREEEPPIYVSPQCEAVVGLPSQALMVNGSARNELLHPDDRARVWERARKMGTNGGDWDIEYRLRMGDGSYRWIHDQARAMPGTEGRDALWFGLLTDLTRTRDAEGALADSEEKYRSLVEQVPAVVYIDSNDVHPSSQYVSPQVTELLGHTPDEFKAQPDFWQRTIHPQDWSRVQAHWRESVLTGAPFRDEYRYVRPDGEVVWVIDDSRLVRAPDGMPMYWQGILQDVTERRRAEEELRAVDARFRGLVEQMPAVVYEMNLDDERRTLYVNPQVEALFGYSRQEWLDQPDIWIELLHPDDREVVLAAHDLHNETGEPWMQEYRLIANDGRVVWVRDQAVLVRDDQGLAHTWQGLMLDITAQKELEERLRLTNEDLERGVLQRTAELGEANEMMALEIGERRRVEAQLRQTRERYRRLVEDMPAVVYLWHVGSSAAVGRQDYASPQIERLLGYTADEWSTTFLRRDRIHPDDADRVIAAAARSEETGEPFEEEYRQLAKDGRVVWVANHATLLRRDEQGRPMLFQGVLLDVTARKQGASEERAAAQLAQLRSLVEGLPGFPWIEVVEGEPGSGRLAFIGPQVETILGYTPDELSGPRYLERIVHPDDRERHKGLSARHDRTGEPWSLDYRAITRDGQTRWLRTRGRASRDDRGRLTWYGVTYDVTREITAATVVLPEIAPVDRQEDG
jgi:PAS domain S-box-containing protein